MILITHGNNLFYSSVALKTLLKSLGNDYFYFYFIKFPYITIKKEERFKMTINALNNRIYTFFKQIKHKTK